MRSFSSDYAHSIHRSFPLRQDSGIILIIQLETLPHCLSFRQPPCKPHAFIKSQHGKQDVILTRLRHNCSSLNGNLFRVNIVNNPRCDCGYAVENARHFLFDCPLYNDQMNPNFDVTDLNMLLNGNPNLDNNINSSIHETVLKYIKDTHRFI